MGIIDKIIAEIQSGNFVTVSILTALSLILNHKKLFAFFESRQKAQINKLLEASKCEQLDDGLKEFVSNELQREYFQYLTKIPAEKKYREKLYELRNHPSGNFPFHRFKRASIYLFFKDGKVSVNITKVDTVVNWLNAFASALFFILGILILLYAFTKRESLIVFFIYEGLGIFSIVASLFMAYLLVPYLAAKRIKRELEIQNL